jgi:hypothetical protein
MNATQKAIIGDRHLAASSPNLDKIRNSIEKFYCGSQISLNRSECGLFWTISNSQKQLSTIVIEIGRRYRFYI